MTSLKPAGLQTLQEIAKHGASRRFSNRSKFVGVARALADGGLVKRAGRDSYVLTAFGESTLAAEAKR